MATRTIDDSQVDEIRKMLSIIDGYCLFRPGQDGFGAIARIQRILDGIAPPAHPYGYCPFCCNPGISRERRPNGNDSCSEGHVYPSSAATSNPKE